MSSLVNNDSGDMRGLLQGGLHMGFFGRLFGGMGAREEAALRQAIAGLSALKEAQAETHKAHLAAITKRGTATRELRRLLDLKTLSTDDREGAEVVARRLATAMVRVDETTPLLGGRLRDRDGLAFVKQVGRDCAELAGACDAALAVVNTVVERNAELQFERGLDFAAGRGVKEDCAQAIPWFRRAAEQGHAKAQEYLGSMYLEGRGLEQDDALAVTWYSKSAAQGYPNAQRHLGNMHAAGRGVPQDAVQAYMWLDLAAKGNATYAVEARNNVAATMTAATIEDAKRLANNWKPYAKDTALVDEHRMLTPGLNAPLITGGTPVCSYKCGSYHATLSEDLESIGPITYPHVLVVFRGVDDAQPIMFVTAEKAVMTDELLDFLSGLSEDLRSETADRPVFLGVFDQSGRTNLGSSENYAILDRFEKTALAVMRDRLGLTAGVEVLSDTRKRSNARGVTTGTRHAALDSARLGQVV